MIGQSKVIAVIPARGGSKGLPKKNILNLCGKPVIAYTIEQALKSKYLDRVIVSTDCEEIAKIAKECGADVPFMRPAELSTDVAHTPPVIEHALQFVESEGEVIDWVVTLQPTSPLRKAKHIDEAIELCVKEQYDSVLSVRASEYSPYWAIKVEDNKAVPFVNDGVDYTLKERQELPQTFEANGAVYVTKRTTLKETGVIISFEKCGIIEMSAKESLDIDTPLDIKIIEQSMESERSSCV